MSPLILNIIQIVIAVLLMAGVLMQQRGSGLSAAFGGDGNVYQTKRGVDKMIFYATIVLSILFIGTSLLRLII